MPSHCQVFFVVVPISSRKKRVGSGEVKRHGHLLKGQETESGFKGSDFSQCYREPRNKPMSHGQLIFDKGDMSIQWSKNTLLNKWC